MRSAGESVQDGFGPGTAGRGRGREREDHAAAADLGSTSEYATGLGGAVQCGLAIGSVGERQRAPWRCATGNGEIEDDGLGPCAVRRRGRGQREHRAAAVGGATGRTSTVSGSVQDAVAGAGHGTERVGPICLGAFEAIKRGEYGGTRSGCVRGRGEERKHCDGLGFGYAHVLTKPGGREKLRELEGSSQISQREIAFAHGHRQFPHETAQR